MEHIQKSIIYDYEQILLGKSKGFHVFDEDIPQKNVKAIIHLYTYVVEDLLGWTPKEAYNNFDADTLHALKLHNTLKKIDMPKGLSEDRKIKYVLSLCYPRILPFSIKDMVLEEYNRVLSDPSAKFVKNYFYDAQGAKKASICLNHAIALKLPNLNIHELYELFADEEEASKFLAEIKLEDVSESLYPTHLDFFHYGSVKNSDFLYFSYKFNRKLAKAS